jgi:hypothetical protein
MQSYGSGKAFSRIRYSLGYIWVAETKGAEGVLVLTWLHLALGWGFWFPRGGFFVILMLRGQVSYALSL